MSDCPVDVGAGTRTHPTLIITRVLSLSHFSSFFLALFLSLSHTDIGEGVQGSRHVATPDCHIQSRQEAALKLQIGA